jgi:hypothetical protein
MKNLLFLIILANTSHRITSTNFNPKIKNSKLIRTDTASKTIFINLKFEKTVNRHPAETLEDTESIQAGNYYYLQRIYAT